MIELPPPPDLSGRRLSVTQTGEGAQRLVDTFTHLGAVVRHIPLIAFESVGETLGLEALQGVQWLVLTSPQGVRALVEALPAPAPVGEAAPQARSAGLKWAAVGESTAQAMRQAGLPVHFTPSQATGQALGQELPLNGGGGTVLHVTSDLSRDDLGDALRARGGDYERLVLYRTVPRQLSAEERAFLLASDAVTLTSSSAAQQLAHLGGQRVPVVAMGRQTAQTARELGFTAVTVARRPTLPALEEGVRQVLAQRPD